MRYELRLATTTSGVGYFASLPVQEGTFDSYLAYLRACPLDDFMHRHLVEMLGQLDEETVRRILEVARDRDGIVMALLYEAALAFQHLEPLKAFFDGSTVPSLLGLTPLIDIRSALREDQPLHVAWMRLLESNNAELEPLPPPDALPLPLPYSREELQGMGRGSVSLARVERPERPRDTARPVELPAPREMADRALSELERIGILASEEVAHESSLSPYGFLRKWHLEISVANRRHDYTLTGIQTSYGKGLTEEAARASYAMEIVERCSSFANVGPEGLLGLRHRYPLLHGSFEELRKSGRNVLDPDALGLEAPYGGEPLHWLEAEERTADGCRPVWIPVQAVFLFCNLDEISLFSGLGSTGLASGSTLEQARVSALLEAIERDCEATMPFHASRCFRLTSEDRRVGELLGDYEARGIQIQFQDLTHELGVPCYKCLVAGSRGGAVKGTGCHLDGRKALLSALTETPYPYPVGPPSGPALEGLPTVRLEDLPRFGTGHPSEDLGLLEALLMANGYRPIHVDLTREDVGIPVVKALVPGLSLSADFDRTSRVSPRLLRNYLRMAGAW